MKPIAWYDPTNGMVSTDKDSLLFTDNIWREVTDGSAGVPLYTTPPQRLWVGLTDEERNEFLYLTVLKGAIDFAKACEAKLKEKNG